MQFGMTIPAQKFFHMDKPPYGEKIDHLFCWELHVISIQGRNCLIGVHCGTRFSFVLADIRRQDSDRLLWMAVAEVKASLLEAGFSGQKVKAYLETAGLPKLTKTHGRSQVAYLNQAVDLTMRCQMALDPETARQPLLGELLNASPTKCTGDPHKEKPEERMKQVLAGFGWMKK